MRQSIPYRVNNIVRSLKQIEIPKPYDPAAMGFQPFGSGGIAAHLQFVGMGFAIELDDKSRSRAEEVGNVRADAGLATEAKTSKLFASQQGPKFPFSLGHVPSQLSGAKVSHFSTPLPSLRDTFPHKGGRKQASATVRARRG